MIKIGRAESFPYALSSIAFSDIKKDDKVLYQKACYLNDLKQYYNRGKKDTPATKEL